MSINNDELKKCEDKLSFVVGKDSKGNIVRASFLELPHLLIAGATGTGKSPFVLTLLENLLKKNTKDELKVYIINPHEIEFKDYINCPQVAQNKVFSKPDEVIEVLETLCVEMKKRYELFANKDVSNYDEYNKKAKKKLAKIIVLIHEYNDYVLSDCKNKFFEYLLKLVMLSRAAGIHIVLATQRIYEQTITREILMQFPTKIAFAMRKEESKLILGNDDAEYLVCGRELIFKNDFNNDFYQRLESFFDFKEYNDSNSRYLFSREEVID